MPLFSDFEVIQTLDTTHDGNCRILLARLEGLVYVIKSISKKSLLADAKTVEHAHNEKTALQHFTKLDHQHINHILGTFQDAEHIHMQLQIVQGLPLHKLLKMCGKVNLPFARLAITQVLLILKDLHKEGYIYRDAKASNFMVCRNAKIVLIDLGLTKYIGFRSKNLQNTDLQSIDNKQLNADSKQITKQSLIRPRTYTICGTPHAMAPQIFNREGYSYEIDYYAAGILLYQLLVGQPPLGYPTSPQALQLWQNNPVLISQRMKQGLSQLNLAKIQCPMAKDLIQKLLCPIHQQRLGYIGGVDAILQHNFFNTEDFLEIMDLYDGVGTINTKKSCYEQYFSEIDDFALQACRYEPIQQSDPFFKFQSLAAIRQKAIQNDNFQSK